MPQSRVCTECGESYTHEPMILGDTDMLDHITICDTCTEKIELRAQQTKRETKARNQWEESVPKEYRQTDCTHPGYMRHMAVHRLSMSWLKGDHIGQDERRLMLGLIGESGRCKTRVISQVAKRIIWEGGSVLWLNSSRFQWACQHQFSDTDGKEASMWLKTYRNASCLVFDDIGSLKSTETVSDNLYALLEHRTAHGLPMLWTSNETIDEMLAGKGLTEKARKRNISRLAGYSNILEL